MTVKTKKQTKTSSKNGFHPDTDEVYARLNVLLADEHLLYVKTLDYHWNVEGLHFVALHELFDQHYNNLQALSDMIAEQIRKLDGEVDGTMKTFLEQTRLTEKPGRDLDEQAMIKNLLADHESIMAILNDDIQFMMDNADEGTADMLIETLRSHQKMAWMLRSMVQ